MSSVMISHHLWKHFVPDLFPYRLVCVVFPVDYDMPTEMTQMMADMSLKMQGVPPTPIALLMGLGIKVAVHVLRRINTPNCTRTTNHAWPQRSYSRH